MKKLFLAIAVAVFAVLVTGCGIQSNMTSNANLNQTQVVLSQNNFHIVKTVETTFKATYVFGIGGLSKQAARGNAIAALNKEANLTGSQALINVNIKQTSKFYLIVLITQWTANGTVIEFGPDTSSRIEAPTSTSTQPAPSSTSAQSAAAAASVASSAAVSMSVDEVKNIEPEYVDLGLSVKWAACNVGASKPEESGLYFAFGDVNGQTWNGSAWSGAGFHKSPSYKLDNNNNLCLECDAAHENYGGLWRMPTKDEYKELINNCKCTWTSNYNGTGIKGRIFTSKKPGYTDKSIFLPACGYGFNGSILYHISLGGYWSSTFISGRNAYELNFSSSNVSISNSECNIGQLVRPVLK